MNNLDELYENLYDFVKNFEILIQKNVFHNHYIDEIKVFGNEIISLCKSKKFNVTISDLMNLKMFNELLNKVENQAKAYWSDRLNLSFRKSVNQQKVNYYKNQRINYSIN